MRSITDLFNLALSHLAQGYVVNDPTEQTPHARLCSTYYPICRQELLDDDHQWTFAVASLPLNIDAGYLAKPAYVLPSDFIRPFQLESGERFFIEGDHLFTEDPAPILRYVRDIKDLAKLPPKFKIALSYLLAWRIAGPLAQSKEKQDKTEQQFAMAKTEAINKDLQQHRIENRPDFEGSLIQAR
ncbi:hypothetical protein F909_03911 [Acinetobacter sp. ANC 3929]|uniref:hypothetical protein n=1 Tax=Acinetobacter sp. ANC 3929 TaxID=1217707 RepID=UPI0002CE0E61|nr:hypothetical protein [Acinetobacter sp. ANC 3929]ENW78225.1 hypothetical protein F909_03911 [Acinetobacter sp. ANC 3929]